MRSCVWSGFAGFSFLCGPWPRVPACVVPDRNSSASSFTNHSLSMNPCPLSIRCRAACAVAVLFVAAAIPASAEMPKKTRPSVANASFGTITLRQAVALAIAKHPALAPYSEDFRAADAQTLQAWLPPNPVVGLTVEDAAGTGDYRGLGGTQNTLQLSQLFELGGKRAARVQAAATQRELVYWDYETKRLEIAAVTVAAFVDVLAAQRRVVQAKESLAFAEKFAPAAQKRLDAGRGSPVEVTRAQAATATAAMNVQVQQGQLAVARKRLSAQWGSITPHFSSAVGDLDQVRGLPSLAAAVQRLQGNPQLARKNADLTNREAKLALEQAKARPDLTVSGGLRQFSDTGDAAIVLGFSIPWPRINRNQGAIEEAHAQLDKVSAQHSATRAQLNAALAVAYEEMENARSQITTYRESLLPQTEKGSQLTNEGYENGRFSYLEVLDAQRSLFDARQQYVEALIRYHKAVAEIEGITGQALPYTPRSSK